jgi:two-component system sensor histidine kinase MtrB
VRSPALLDPAWSQRAAVARSGLSAAWARVRRRWRTSLQTRVVMTTLVVSGVVVALLASLLLGQVGRGLVDAKLRSALPEARAGLLQGQAALNANESTAPAAINDLLFRLANDLNSRGAAGGLYRVALLGSPGSRGYSTTGLDRDQVPEALAAQLAAGTPTAYVVTDVETLSGRESHLVVGSVLKTGALGDYRLYHLFPLSNERETFSLVRRATAAAGFLLVGLLALIAGLVARQVVSPVRLAARTAGRFAAGHLEARMRVSGEDELARLGSTFNAMAEALQAQIRQLEDLSRVQRRFVSDVSHELRTPLTTVRMAADVLFEARADFPAHVARSAELLQTELGRFEELLVDLLEISRYDAGATALDAAPTDLVALLHRVVASAQPLADRRGSLLDLSAVPPGPVVADVDPVRIERVLRNLIVNAVEHGEGRPVEVRLDAMPDAVEVLVRDHGVGLREGEAAMVFTRFWRGDPSRARTTGGTGLGLAIALEDARLHRGWLQAWGRPDEGAAFRLTLPRQAGRTVEVGPLEQDPALGRRPPVHR